MALCASTFQKSTILIPSPRKTQIVSRTDSTTDPEVISDSNHQISYSLVVQPLLHLVVESTPGKNAEIRHIQ
jgi:hypothetical protein